MNMKPLLGIDVGTTSVSLVVVDPQDGHTLYIKSKLHHADIAPDGPGAHLQNPDAIISTAQKMLKAALQIYPDASAIGITGQMHGVICIDAAGKAVSPLYTWLDKRGEWKGAQGKSYRDVMKQELGFEAPTGYGACTIFSLARQKKIASAARAIVTLPDYLALRLSEQDTALTDSSLAHSLGLFSMDTQSFMDDVWRVFSPLKLPRLTEAASFIGKSHHGPAVCLPIGDNQAGFLGSIRDPSRSILFNLGTSGQVSFVKPVATKQIKNSILEERPLPGEKILCVGASLCGGKSFELITGLIEEAYTLAGIAPTDDPFSLLNRLPLPARETDALIVDTRFAGTRRSPQQRGAIHGISLENFTFSQLYWGIAKGVIQELTDMVSAYQGFFSKSESYIVASGNALERSKAIQTALFQQMQLPLRWPKEQEAAARGAAILAGAATLGGVSYLKELQQKMLHYHETPPF